MMKECEPITYQDLTTEIIEKLSPQEAELLSIKLMAERASVESGGQILSWSDFNENPDPLINQLLAIILVSQVDRKLLEGKKASQIGVLSIENSAGYLTSEICHELKRQFDLVRPPRIIRARKSPDGSPPSGAMGEIVAKATVTPITSLDKKPKFLVASIPDIQDLHQIKNLFVIDDFGATGDSRRGGVDLGIDLLSEAQVSLSELTVLPMVALVKPKQEQTVVYKHPDVNILDVISALSVRFEPDWETGHALLFVNGFEPLIMQKASAKDFFKSN